MGHGCLYVGGLKSVMMLGLCSPQKSENTMYQEFDFFFFSPLPSLVVSDSKESACNAGDPESGGSPGDGNSTQSSSLAWRIPWTEGPDGLQSMGSQRVRLD